MNIRSGIFAAIVLLIPGSALAQEYTLKFGHAATSTHLFQDGLVMFADKVAEKTSGKVKIEVYGDRQLGDDKQLLEGVQLGTIDGALVSVPTIPLTLNAPAFDALQLPFLVPSYDKMAAVLSSEVGQQLLDSLAPSGIKGLGYIEAGQRHFLSRTKAVRTVGDFSGLKTRIVPTPLHKAVWEAVGVSPIGMAFGEVFSALETGTIDAVEINLSSAYAESYYEAAKNVTLTGHYFWPGVLMTGGAKFESLPDDVKTALAEAGREVIAEQYALARDQEAEIADKLKEKGVTISQLSDLTEMQARVRPVFESWLAKDPLIQAFVDTVRKTD
jgi:tripartite ATP-independent transporter DctP family solute receptor